MVNFRKLLLPGILLFNLSVVQAVVDPNSNVNLERVTEDNSSAPGSCIKKGFSPTNISSCCEGLILKDSLCTDPSVRDDSLKYCNSINDCTEIPGTGCFPLRKDDNFSQISGERALFLEDEMDKQESEFKGPFAVGEACKIDAQCESFSCNGQVCVQDKSICRFGDKNERVSADVKCEAGLILSGGICNAPSGESTYPGMHDSINIGVNKCQFELGEPMKSDANAAMKSMRAMEWILSEVKYDDCMMINKYLREKIVKPLLVKRKELLMNFNEELKKIEGDQRILMAVDEKVQGTVSFEGMAIASKDLATRRLSGVDMILLMMRKNELLHSYEVAMNKNTSELLVLFDALETDMKNMSDHQSRKWYMDGKEYHGGDETCRGGGLLGLGRKRIYKRWSTRTRLDRTSDNLSMYDNENFLHALKRITARDNTDLRSGDVSELRSKLKDPSTTFHLIDPLVTQNIDVGNLKKSKEAFKDRIKAYYASLKIKTDQKNFVFEPELMKLEARECINGPQGAICNEFDKLLDDLSTVGLAQQVAYGIHNRSKYKYFFEDENTWRRKLIAHWKTSITNLDHYYSAMAKYREEQAKCLKIAMDGSSSTLDKTANGLNEGSYNFFDGDEYSGANRAKRTMPSAEQKLSMLRSKFQFDLLSSKALNSKGGSSALSSSGNNSGSGLIDSLLTKDAAAISRVRNKMKTANAKAATKGMDFSPPTKIASTPSGIPVSPSSPQTSNTTSSSTDTKAPEGPASELVKDASSGKEGLGNTISSDQGAASSGHSVSTSFAGIDQGIGSNQNGEPYKDPTGLSDEQKDVMLRNFERNRSSYKATEEDNLFQVVSKAYVRSLDRVLTRRKANSE